MMGVLPVGVRRVLLLNLAAVDYSLNRCLYIRSTGVAELGSICNKLQEAGADAPLGSVDVLPKEVECFLRGLNAALHRPAFAEPAQLFRHLEGIARIPLRAEEVIPHFVRGQEFFEVCKRNAWRFPIPFTRVRLRSLRSESFVMREGPDVMQPPPQEPEPQPRLDGRGVPLLLADVLEQHAAHVVDVILNGQTQEVLDEPPELRRVLGVRRCAGQSPARPASRRRHRNENWRQFSFACVWTRVGPHET
mmetsp:Transcript_6242/g.15800  ORF Transcript_6242/g.15800 Transcript_6242/m.15800 type:complete len:248 (-) Transcript_6242:17-760(-)